MTESKRVETMSFEGDGFMQECLDAFDSNVALIEKEYEVTSKSA